VGHFLETVLGTFVIPKKAGVQTHDYSFLIKHRAMYAFVCFVFYPFLAIITHLLYLYMRNELEPQSLFASCYGSYIYPGHLLTSYGIYDSIVIPLSILNHVDGSIGPHNIVFRTSSLWFGHHNFLPEFLVSFECALHMCFTCLTKYVKLSVCS